MRTIFVTKTFLPPIEEYMSFIERAYKNGWLTNRGELVKELEDKLSTFLNLNEARILCLTNGTIPLQIALKLLGKGGEIITTPFSYVATTAAIVWENCTPVFVDIHPEYLTIDETQIEAAITEKTTCILATHVFGNPCNVVEIERIANKHNLKVIYDGAHCFGVKYNDKSIFEYGDICTTSFHATKLFHSGEGGAMFTKDEDLYNQIVLSHSFGHVGDEYFQLGINGKMSELQAAMGLSVLPYIEEIIVKRNKNHQSYIWNLSDFFKSVKIRELTDYNYGYVPLIFNSEEELNLVISKLKENQIFPRRYFYPSLNTISFYAKNSTCVISEKISSRVLCLPSYHELSEKEIAGISELIVKSL